MDIEQKRDPPLNRAEILAALDYEIASIEKEQISPGWTKWTFYGGFATLVWAAIIELAKKEFTPFNAVLVLLLCSILVDLAEQVVRILKPSCERPSATNRFKLISHEFGGSRLQMLGTVIRLSALLGSYYFLRTSPQQYVSGWFIWFYCVLLAVLIVGFILSYSGLPINTQPALKTWQKCALNFAMFVPLSIAVYQAGLKAHELQAVFTVSDIRLGLITTVFLWLLPVSFSHINQNQPLLDALKNVRRDLAFDRIDPSSALRQADIALDGMRVEDYLQSDLQKVLQHFDSASKSMRELQDRIREAGLLVQSWEQTPPLASVNGLAPAKMLRAIEESCSFHQKKIEEAISAAGEAAKAYAKKKPWVKRLVAESEFERIESNIKSFIDRFREQTVDAASQEKAFKESLAKLAQKYPQLLSGPRVE